MYDGKIGKVFTLSSETKADPRWWGGEACATMSSLYWYFRVCVNKSSPELCSKVYMTESSPKLFSSLCDWVKFLIMF